MDVKCDTDARDASPGAEWIGSDINGNDVVTRRGECDPTPPA